MEKQEDRVKGSRYDDEAKGGSDFYGGEVERPIIH
jgi:hypothetical protein